jgi:hypothetical protein
MSNKLSFSKISSYSICGERYRLHYIEKLREKWARASLLFGSAIDESLNSLLENRDLDKAKQIFLKTWNFQYVNNKMTALKNNPDIVYASADLDLDLIELTEENRKWLKEFEDFKSQNKWDYISEEDRSTYNSFCWESMKAKGLLILENYSTKVLPQFLSVTAIQHKTELVNGDGDSVTQVLDFIATLHDGSVVLFDNKTTSNLSYYPDDAPATSQQLVSYYYNNKQKFGITAVGFVAIQKLVIKNKTKTCTKCGFDGTESRAKTCDQEHPGMVVKRGKEVEGMVRCNGEWDVKMNPEVAIKLIVNPVPDASVDLVLSAFDEANHGIKTGNFYKNLTVCKNIYGSPCTYYNLCWKGKDEELVKLEDNKKSS